MIGWYNWYGDTKCDRVSDSVTDTPGTRDATHLKTGFMSLHRRPCSSILYSTVQVYSHGLVCTTSSIKIVVTKESFFRNRTLYSWNTGIYTNWFFTKLWVYIIWRLNTRLSWHRIVVFTWLNHFVLRQHGRNLFFSCKICRRVFNVVYFYTIR